MQTKKRGFQALLLIAFICWLSALGTGFAILAREQFTPVPSTDVTVSFPAQSAVPLATDKPTLVVFLHPLCPCSRASLHELNQLLTETKDKLSVVAVFTVADGLPADWKKGDLWTSVAAMPGVQAVCDQHGTEARRFGVKGSGHALLYSPSGELVFSGGITGSRGHEGDNSGEMAVVSFVLHGHSTVSRTPVFGCSLL